MYRIHMLPAEYGDSLLIEYGESAKPKRILIDAGTSGSYPAVRRKLESIPKKDRHFELFVVTHIDADHIGGVLTLLDEAEELGVTFGEVWFNAYDHLTDVLGEKQAERLSSRIEAGGYKWNEAFGRSAVVVPDDGDLPTVDVGGMKITLLSPKRAQLVALEKEWRKVIEAAGLVPGIGVTLEPEEIDDLLGDEDIDVPALADSKFRSDAAKANGSSIAFAAEFGEKSVLFGADAFPGVLADSLQRMPEKDRRKISVLKLPHHGSCKNLSNDLLTLLDCKTFLVSSNGKRFSHPNQESIARVIHRGGKPHVVFNYRTDFNECWDNENLMKQHGYTVEYGEDGEMTVDV